MYTVPKSLHIKDIVVTTSVASDLASATVNYVVTVESEDEGDQVTCGVQMLDRDGNQVTVKTGNTTF